MAIPNVYKSITDHQKQCEFAESFMKDNREDLGAALSRVFAQDISEGDSVPDVLPFMDALLLRLRRSLEVLTEAEKVHLNELDGHAVYRVLRDEAVATLRRHLVNLRFLFRSSYGQTKAEDMGFDREIAQDPIALLRQARRLLGNLQDPELTLPASEFAGVAVTPASIAEQLASHVGELREALTEVNDDLGRSQRTLVSKDRAVASFRQTYALFLVILQSGFRLGGDQEMASRLRRSVRRSRSRSDGTVPDGTVPDGAVPDGTVPDATVPDEPE